MKKTDSGESGSSSSGIDILAAVVYGGAVVKRRRFTTSLLFQIPTFLLLIATCTLYHFNLKSKESSIILIQLYIGVYIPKAAVFAVEEEDPFFFSFSDITIDSLPLTYSWTILLARQT